MIPSEPEQRHLACRECGTTNVPNASNCRRCGSPNLVFSATEARAEWIPTQVEKKGGIWYLSDDLPPHPPVKPGQTNWIVRSCAAILFLIGIGNLKNAPGIAIILILVALGVFFRLTDRAETFATQYRPLTGASDDKGKKRLLAAVAALFTAVAAVVVAIIVLATLAVVAGGIFLFIACARMINNR